MKIKIDDELFDSIEEAADYLADDYCYYDDDFESAMDESMDEIELFGSYYSPIYLLKQVDKDAYHKMKNDWRNSIYDDMIYELNREEDYVFGYNVEYIEEEEDEECE